MKKKIINGFLMAALMLTATTSFVSCKDNVDDEMVGVYNNLAKQKKELQDQIGALEKRVNENAEAIKKNSEAIQDLQNDIEEINAELASLDTRLTKAEEDIKKLQEDLDAVGKRIDELEKTVEELIGGLVQDFYAEHTVNHVIGSINVPGVNVLSLAAFYGTNETLIEEFPTADERFIVDQANGARLD